MVDTKNSEVVIVIPARFASQRYPGKPLAPLVGATGLVKPLIHRSWEAAQLVTGVSRVVVATDSKEIANCVEAFGGEFIWTSSECRNGTERCAEVLSKLDREPNLIVNLQGDAPLTPQWFVEGLIETMRITPSAEVATPCVRVAMPLFEKLAADERRGIVGGTFAATTGDGRALYFSKRMIPFLDPAKADPDRLPVWLHIGLYAYRPAALRRYMAAEQSELEVLEGLEQLRFLDMGADLRVVDVAAPDWEIWELNNPGDIPHIEQALKTMGVE